MEDLPELESQQSNELILAHVVDSLETAYDGTTVAFRLVSNKPNLTNASPETVENWKVITEKAWSAVQENSTRFQQISEILALFTKVHNISTLQQQSLANKSVERTTLRRIQVELKDTLQQLKIKCAALPGGEDGSLDILKKKAEEVFGLMGPGYQSIRSQFRQIQELNNAIEDLQSKLIQLYDNYYSEYLPQLANAEVSLKRHQLKSQHIDNEIQNAKNQRELLQRQLEIARQKDNAHRDALSQEYMKRQSQLSENFQNQLQSTQKSQQEYEDMVSRNYRDHNTRMENFRNELNSIK